MQTMCGRSNFGSPSSAADDAAEARVLDRPGRGIAGVELIGGPLVVALLVGHRADQGDVLHRRGGLLPALGDLDAGHGGVDRLGLAAVVVLGLGVEGLELARAARHPEQDAGHLPLAQVVGVDGHQVGEAQARSAPPPPGRSPSGTRGGRARPGRSSRPSRRFLVDHRLIPRDVSAAGPALICSRAGTVGNAGSAANRFGSPCPRARPFICGSGTRSS